MFDEVDPSRIRSRGSAKWAPGFQLSAGLAELDFDPPQAVRDAIIERVQQGDVGRAHPLAVESATHAFVDWAGRRWGWEVESQAVVLIPDVMRVLDFCLQHLVTPRSAVVVPTSAFPPLLSVPSDWRHPVVMSPMVHREGRWQLNLDDLSRCFEAGAELLVLCHPLGTSMTVGEMEALALVVDHHGATVMSDEIHAPLTYTTTAAAPSSAMCRTRRPARQRPPTR